MLNRLVLGVVAIMAAAVTRPAAATPFIDVTALGEAFLSPPLPPGLSITCTGGAVFFDDGNAIDGFGDATGCRVEATVDHLVTSNEVGEASQQGGLLVTNTGTAPFSGVLHFTLGLSGLFGGPGAPTVVALSIDNARQSASFESLGIAGYVDPQGCSLPGPPGGAPPRYFSEFQCGLPSPLTNEAFEPFSQTFSLAPGETQPLVGANLLQVDIRYQFAGIPEPSVLGLLAPGMLVLGLLRRRATRP